jgi:hypothetical protein
VLSEEWGVDLEAEVAVVTGDVPMGASVEQAASAIRLVMLVNDVSLRNLIPNELAKGFGFYQSKPASAFSPVAVTPDELGDAWQDSKLHLPLLVTLNDEPFGKPNAGEDMTFSFAQLVAHAAKTRELGAGQHHRFRHGVEQAGRPARFEHRQRRRRLLLPGRSADVRNHRTRRPDDAIPALRRQRAHRDAGRRWRQHLRRHRSRSTTHYHGRKE